MIEIGTILVFIAVGYLIFGDPDNVYKPMIVILSFIIGVFLLCSIKIFHIQPKIYVKDEYTSTKIVDSENTDHETTFECPVLIQKIKIDYPHTFVIDHCYYKIFPIHLENNIDPNDRSNNPHSSPTK